MSKNIFGSIEGRVGRIDSTSPEGLREAIAGFTGQPTADGWYFLAATGEGRLVNVDGPHATFEEAVKAAEAWQQKLITAARLVGLEAIMVEATPNAEPPEPEYSEQDKGHAMALAMASINKARMH
jgi:hypothetical protein